MRRDAKAVGGRGDEPRANARKAATRRRKAAQGDGRRTKPPKAQKPAPLSVRAATRPAHEPFAPSQSKRADVACMDAIRTFPKRARENPPEDV